MPDRDEAGRFLPGNTAWPEAFRNRSKPRKFQTGEDLRDACISYFEWATENPIIVDNVGWFQGRANHEEERKARPLTVEGLCVYIGIATRTWRAWSEESHKDFRADLAPVIEEAEAAMYSYNFDGASAGIFNAGIIARKLGLSDKQEIEGNPDKPLTVQTVTRKIVDPKDGA